MLEDLLNVGREGGDVFVNGAGSGLIKVTGHVKQGDLLETSNVPGVAWKHSGQNPAAVVAKAREDTLNDGAVHLIRCTLLAV